MSNPIPGTENIKWIEYGGAVVIRGSYDESMIEDAEKFLAEQAVETVRQIMEEAGGNGDNDECCVNQHPSEMVRENHQRRKDN